MNSPRTHDGHSSGGSRRAVSTRRPTSSSRHAPSTRPSSSYLKTGDKHGPSAHAPPRHIVLLDQTRMPTFYDKTNTRVPFTETELKVWFRRLSILYQIDKGRNYGEVIDNILRIFQFISTEILFKNVRLVPETYATDEVLVNDIARARMHFFEEWASDGNPHRPVTLTKGYQTFSPNILVNTPLPSVTSEKTEDVLQSTTMSPIGVIDPFEISSTDTDD